jgi:hypothetical protein
MKRYLHVTGEGATPNSNRIPDGTKIQSLGDWWHHLESTWIVRCAHSPREVRDQLKLHLGTDDQLLVLEISGDTAEWAGVNGTGSQWLKENI